MPQYRYRRLQISSVDQVGDPGRRRSGDQPGRWLIVLDSARDDPVNVTDRPDEDGATFEARAWREVLVYLDMLGGDGWRLVTFTPQIHGNGVSASWPVGDHLFFQET
jgi:hypothetical protein